MHCFRKVAGPHKKKATETSTFIFVPPDLSLSPRLRIQQLLARAISLLVFQLFLLEICRVFFVFFHIFRWIQNTCRLWSINMNVYSLRKDVYVCLHTHIWVVSMGNRESISTNLKSAGNTNVKCEHIWVTKTAIHILSPLKQVSSNFNALLGRAPLYDTCTIKMCF